MSAHAPGPAPTGPARLAIFAPRLAGLLLLLAGTSLPWWSLSVTSSVGTVSFDYGLTYVCVRAPTSCAPLPVIGQDGLPVSDPLYETFRVVLAMSLGALPAALLALLLPFAHGRIHSAARASAASLLASSGLALAGPLYAFIVLPVAFRRSGSGLYESITGYFGTAGVGDVAYAYGGAAGWILTVIAGALFMTLVAFEIRGMRRR